ncbi:MAG: hypothetical protein WAT18_00980 [Sphingorhabdus sp.]
MATMGFRHRTRRKTPRSLTQCALAILALLFCIFLTPPAAHAQIQRTIVNGGFEANNPGGAGAATFQLFPNASVPGWDAVGGSVELWDNNFQSVPAAEGVVFAELNVNGPDTFYQNICVLSGDSFAWRYRHRFRASSPSPQTVFFEIANSSATVLQLIDTSSLTSAAGAWTTRSGTATYAGVSGTQRVQLRTTTAGGAGNLLDDFSMGLRPVIELSTAATTANEAAVGPTLPAIRVNGTVATAFTVQVSASGTATLGSDYTTPSGTATISVNIPAGTYANTDFPLGITIIHDGSTEASETIQLQLAANNAVYARSSTATCGNAAIINAVHTITDTPLPIVANPDAAIGVNGFTGVSGLYNVLGNDSFNSALATIAQVTIAELTAATPIDGGPVPTLDTATGALSVPAGTPGGIYTTLYRICEIAFPANCATATASVTVDSYADLRITKTNTPGVNGEMDQAADSVVSGLPTSYSLVVTNSGPSRVTGAIVTDTPVAGISCPASNPVNISGAGIPPGSFTVADLIGTGITLATLLSGQAATLTFDCVVD